MHTLPMKLDPYRIIEINSLGKFYVMGFPKFIVMEAPHKDPAFHGFIITPEKTVLPDVTDIHSMNCVYKLDDKLQLVAKLLIKNREMAEEICFACNRIKT